MKKKTMNRIPAVFYFIVIKNKLIEKNYPSGLKKFRAEFEIKTYNKDISVLSFMTGQYRDDFIFDVIAKMKINRHDHFALGEEVIYYGVEGKETMVPEPNIDTVDWLKAYNLPEGNFVEFIKNKK